MGSIDYLVGAIKQDLLMALPHQRKTQRDKLALLVATMLHAKTANTMELAAELPLATERLDMRYHWVSRFLRNPLVKVREVIEPLGRFILAKLVEKKQTVVLVIDQTEVSKDLNLLMIGVRWVKELSLFYDVRKKQRATLALKNKKSF